MWRLIFLLLTLSDGHAVGKKNERLMRKKNFRSLSIVVAIAIALGISYKTYCAYVPVVDSVQDLFLAEEALAVGENDSDPNSKYKFEGGFKDCEMSVSYCANCGMSVGAGKCSLTYNLHFSCSYTVTKQVAAHMYDCWSGSRMTEVKCKAIMQKYGAHPKEGCLGHY